MPVQFTDLNSDDSPCQSRGDSSVCVLGVWLSGKTPWERLWGPPSGASPSPDSGVTPGDHRLRKEVLCFPEIFHQSRHHGKSLPLSQNTLNYSSSRSRAAVQGSTWSHNYTKLNLPISEKRVVICIPYNYGTHICEEEVAQCKKSA